MSVRNTMDRDHSCGHNASDQKLGELIEAT